MGIPMGITRPIAINMKIATVLDLEGGYKNEVTGCVWP